MIIFSEHLMSYIFHIKDVSQVQKELSHDTEEAGSLHHSPSRHHSNKVLIQVSLSYFCPGRNEDGISFVDSSRRLAALND